MISIDDVATLITQPSVIVVLLLVVLYLTPAIVACVCVVSVLLFRILWNLNGIYKRHGVWEPLGKDDVALITGGANGLGLELSLQLAQRGVKVIVIDKAAEVPNTLEGHIVYERCDLSNSESLLSLIKKVIATHGYPTVLVNNAAVRDGGSLQELTSSQAENIVSVNTLAPLLLMRECLKTSRRIYTINVASVLGFVSPANLSMYSSTKAALISLHDSISHEYSSDVSKRFLLVAPGQLNTAMFQNVTPPRQWLAPVLDARALATTIVQKCNQGERGTVHGPVYTYFIPILRLLPYSLAELCRWFSEMDTSVKKGESDA
ncbi:hypothetical protein BN1211_5460 [Cyberlindnera jadinii]|uniref:NAD(P)-binding protein n=1 Tax=Cyberlindnera jadinii (strain ATCC 18201 / CBS 1600 / BCRC 20928 / JCM 3617 / NBRC 0987 / NRRL Y-1542) TaxID=983966 RepID=A0A0H5C8H1_CYBJN|nr:hypothetical protein BN1211_5460 [Cyberlindnera jadinii]